LANRETQLRRIIEELFEIAAPSYLKTSLWKAYQVILSESGQKATRTEMNKGVLEPIEPHIQQVLTDIARTYQADRKEAKGYENTESAICEALFPIVIPGSAKNSLWTAYQATEGKQKGSTTLTENTFNQERAIARYASVMSLIHVGAYSDGDETEQAALDLDYEAARHGLEFHYHQEEDRYSLEPLSVESKAAFLHVNVEKLISLLRETASFLLKEPRGESAIDKTYRMGLFGRVTEALGSSYLVPAIREESED
jgi:hypothetical protein